LSYSIFCLFFSPHYILDLSLHTPKTPQPTTIIKMQFSTLVTLALSALTVSATPYHGQYNYPSNTTLPTLPATYVFPTGGIAKPTGIVNTTTTTTPYASTGASYPSSTGGSYPTISPFTGGSPPVKEASLALVVLAVGVVGWL
jgi:hypothetical protein